MTVLYIADRVDKYGSIDSFKQMVDALFDNYHIKPIIIHYKKGNLYEWAKERGYEFHIISYKSLMIPRVSNNHIIRIIIIFLYKIYHYLFTKISLSQIKRNVKISDVDIIHTNINRIDLGIILSKKYNIPHVWHIREYPPSKLYPIESIKKSYINIINKSNSIIVISSSLKKQWVNNGLDEKKTYVIWDGVVNNKSIDKYKDILEDELVKIVISGYINPNKGQDQLIRAFSLLPDTLKKKIEIDIMGDHNNKYFHELQKIIEEKKIKNVKFLGFVDNANDIYSNYDIGVNCSLCEGLGRVTIDYMNHGCLVIASSIDANIELIKDGVNGYLYEYNNIIQLKDVLIKAINDVNESRKIAKNGIKFARTNFECNKYSSEIFTLYNSVINETVGEG